MYGGVKACISFRTGVIGFTSLGLTFIPTVVSVFLPGSPFKLVPGVRFYILRSLGKELLDLITDYTIRTNLEEGSHLLEVNW